MKVVTPSQMRQMDNSAIHDYGIPGAVLMERAALGAVDFLERELRLQPSDRVALMCGGGNNGGDGFAMARILMERGYVPSVFILSSPSSYSDDALQNLNTLVKLMPVHDLSDTEEDEIAARIHEHGVFDVWCDAVFGTGLDREVQGRHRAAITLMSDHGKVFAIDIPSGLDAMSGEVLGVCAAARATASFGALKLGQCLAGGVKYCGVVEVVAIGIPEAVCAQVGWEATLIDASALELSKRPPEFYKGEVGKVLLLGGQPGQLGAILMSAKAALLAGAGLLIVGSADTHVGLVPIAIPEAMSMDLFSSDLADRMEWCDVVAIGPGLGVNPETARVWNDALDAAQACVIDADGLNLLAENQRALPPKAILTPHAGEMARLMDIPVPEVLADPVGVVRSAAKRFGAVVVLKGSVSLIAAPDGRLGISQEGNPGMATGGMGDALTGIASAFLAHFEDPFDAACCAVWVHGSAGDLAGMVTGERGLTVSALLDALPTILQRLER